MNKQINIKSIKALLCMVLVLAIVLVFAITFYGASINYANAYNHTLSQATTSSNSLSANDEAYLLDEYNQHIEITPASSSISGRLYSGDALRARSRDRVDPLRPDIWPYFRIGTLAANAICNVTGLRGILTNEHVANHEYNPNNRIYDRRNRFIGTFDATNGNGFLNNYLDAAFVPFADQNAWELTPYIRNYSDIQVYVWGLPNPVVGRIRRHGATGNNVIKYGSTTGLSEGRHYGLMSFDVGPPGNIRTMKGQMNTTLTVRGGDSGSALLTRGSLSNCGTRNYYIRGLIHSTRPWRNYQGVATQIHWITNYSSSHDDTTFSGLNLTIYCIDIHNLDLQVSNGEVTVMGITAGRHNVTDISIPRYYMGLPITRIAPNAFAWQQQLTSVRLPYTLTHIGANAFRGTFIESVYIPPSVDYIGDNAFADNHLLQTLTFGADSRLRVIGDSAFRGSGIASLDLPSSLERIGATAFAGAPVMNVPTVINRPVYVGTWLIGIRGQLPSTYILRASTVGIADGALSGQANLATLTLPDSLRFIGASSFNNTQLTSLTIPSSVRHIGNNAFANTSNLATINIQGISSLNQIPNFGTEIFRAHNANLRIFVPICSIAAYQTALRWQGVDGRIVSTVNSEFSEFNTIARSGGSAVAIYIPMYFADAPYISARVQGAVNGAVVRLLNNSDQIVGTVDSAGFTFVPTANLYRFRIAQYTQGDRPVTLQILVAELAPGLIIQNNIVVGFEPPASFNGELIIPHHVLAIAPNAFRGNTRITSIKVPSTVTTIGARAFDSAAALRIVHLTNSITYIGQAAFFGTSSLEAVYTESARDWLPMYLQAIAPRLFENSSIQHIVVAQPRDSYGTLIVGDFAFANTPRLRYVGMYDNRSFGGVEQIGTGAFLNSAVRYVNFSRGLTSIGEQAFANTHNLQQAYLAHTRLTRINERTFYRSNLNSIVFPSSNTLASIEQNAFSHTRLTDIIIPASVHTIAANAFTSSSLARVTITRPIAQGVVSLGANALANNPLTQIIVPCAASVAAYSAAANWSAFFSIIQTRPKRSVFSMASAAPCCLPASVSFNVPYNTPVRIHMHVSVAASGSSGPPWYTIGSDELVISLGQSMHAGAVTFSPFFLSISYSVSFVPNPGAAGGAIHITHISSSNGSARPLTRIFAYQ